MEKNPRSKKAYRESALQNDLARRHASGIATSPEIARYVEGVPMEGLNPDTPLPALNAKQSRKARRLQRQLQRKRLGKATGK